MLLANLQMQKSSRFNQLIKGMTVKTRLSLKAQEHEQMRITS